MFFLYDRFAQLQVTINGQLMTMTLVEELELNGIHVISANTDGIVIKLPKDKLEVFNDITKDGMKLIEWVLIVKIIKRILLEM